MKFDVVVGNPPYQNTHSAKRWPLWAQFVSKSLELSNKVAMIVPKSIVSPGNSFESIKDKCDLINFDIDKYFNVGSTFCYFITGNNAATKLITENEVYEMDISKFSFLPSNLSDESFEMLNALINRKKRTWKRGELHTSNKDLFVDDGKYSVMHTNAQTLRTNVEHRNLNKVRVGVTLSGYPTFKVINGGHLSQACFWSEFESIEEAENFANECNGESIQTIMSNFKWSGWNSKEIIEYL
jgi:hypothetical protein